MSSFVKASGSITPNSADPGEEFPFLHTITVVDRVVSVDKPELVQNNIKTETVTLNLDSEWEGLSTVINIGNEKPVPVIWSGEPVVIPAELMTTVGSLDVSVVGYGDDGGIRAVTKKATSIFNVVASGFVEGDEAVPDPTTLLSQLIQAADNANTAADRFNQASEDIEGIGPAIEKVQASEANAKQSETNAAASAESASQSASTASTSAEAARTSETNAATSAAAAQEAVDGFGLEVGTTTTTDPGTDAVVEIQKSGTKYTANFTIPRGDVGPAGVNENVPLGSTSGVVAQASDAYPALPRKVQVHGRRIENLFENFSRSVGGVTVNCDESGLFSFSGTATSGGYPSVSIILKPNTKYTLSVCGNLTGINQVYVESHVSSSESTDWNAVGPQSSNTTKTFVTASDITSTRCGFEFKRGANVTASFRVMLVEGDMVPDAFVPSGVNTVKPTKLVTVGKNQWYPFLTSQFARKGITVTQNDDRSYTIDGESQDGGTIYITQSYSNLSYNLVPGATVTTSCWDGQGRNITSDISDKIIIQATCFTYSGQSDITTASNFSGVVPYNYRSDRFQITIKPGTSFDNLRIYPQVEFGNKATSWESPITKIETNLPSDISLADGDTLAIDRDGTTQIVHAEGEPTVLENVTLPELPAPTFNVYTTGGYIQPTVDVDYERDVNLVLQALTAKIASLEVAQTIMQGA